MAHATTKTLPREQSRPKERLMPLFRVLLHNDDVNDMVYVVATIMELVALSQVDATQRMLEAHHKGVALLLVTHKERAELLVEQFASKGLTVTLEPDES
jgi:ATP-dependent Clp protease adaptor protein ClpS